MPVGMLLDMAADAFKDRQAITSGPDQVTYGQLRQAAARGAASLAAAGARHVAYLGTNGLSFPVALLSAALAGVPFTALNYRLSGEQISSLLKELDEPFVIADDAFAAVVPAAKASRTWYTDGAPGTAALVFPGVDDPAVALFTSGTTSRPKGVLLSHGNLVSYVLQTVAFGSSDAGDAALISVPPYHIAGIGTVLTNLYAGRRMVYLSDFSAEAWLRTVRAEGVTHAMLVPTMLAGIVEYLDGRSVNLPTLRHVAYGGARMPRPVLIGALRAFPDTDFVNAYGLTETSSTIAILGPEDHRAALATADPVVAARLSSAGRMVPGVEGQIRDRQGAVLDAGQTGELWVRGAQVSGRYMGTGSVLDDDGWFPTRDRGFIDPGGYLFIEGRADDTIIRGGENIAPAEIEDVLFEHPEIADAAVFGVPDEHWGERIVAMLVPAPGAAHDSAGVRQWVKDRLRSSRTPDDVVFVSELPRTTTGKLSRHGLIDAYREHDSMRKAQPWN